MKSLESWQEQRFHMWLTHQITCFLYLIELCDSCSTNLWQLLASFANFFTCVGGFESKRRKSCLQPQMYLHSGIPHNWEAIHLYITTMLISRLTVSTWPWAHRWSRGTISIVGTAVMGTASTSAFTPSSAIESSSNLNLYNSQHPPQLIPLWSITKP